eukprot:3555432-Alexandrium_andersonii.AAC.1
MAQPSRVVDTVREECARLRAIAVPRDKRPEPATGEGAAPPTRRPASAGRLRLVPARADQEWGVTEDEDERPPPPSWTHEAAIREADRLAQELEAWEGVALSALWRGGAGGARRTHR